jgi:hypothetical protein
MYERMGAEPDAALTRLRWAQSLAAAGARDRAAEVVVPARDYYGRARATRYLEAIEALSR